MPATTGSWDKLQIFSQAAVKIDSKNCSISFKSKGAIPHIHAFILTPVSTGSEIAKNFEQTIKGKKILS